MSAKAHYENHLARFYSWMCGDRKTRQREFSELLRHYQVKPFATGHAIDFGAGHGLQAFPLAELGFNVLAVDFNETLLNELKENQQGLAVDVLKDDLCNVLKHEGLKPELILCWGDTLLHLESKEEIKQFLSDCISILIPGGKLMLSFRDYSTALKGTQRFIPVKSDESRILTCFLEYTADAVLVTDLLHEKDEQGWKQTAGTYQKVRMLPGEIKAHLESLPIQINYAEMQRGLYIVIVQK